MTDTRTTRAERMTMPLARDSIRKIAESVGGCLRPVQLRRIDTVTGQTEQVMIPCGATLASICPPCAERAKSLRAVQCREGWHLEDEPDPGPPAPDQTQELWLTLRAEAQVKRDRAEARGEDVAVYDALIGELDVEVTRAGVRGTVTTSGKSSEDGKPKTRRVRSTRRRQDAPDLPKRKIAPRTVGKVFIAPDGRSYRPSMFLTLTCDSYGKVKDDGTPIDPATYDYRRAARDALHFSALTDRFIQNLRRVLGYEAQYFGAVEPQKRLAPHLHMAIRGAIPRAVVRQVLAATYHQVWWPSTDTVRYDGDNLPVWDKDLSTYLDPATGEVLPTWDQALDAIGPNDTPWHVARFGSEFHAEGVLAGSKDAARCIGYLTKYLTKNAADCHQADSDAQRAHVDRLTEALRFEPCSPTCANWLRYGIQPKNARPGLRPGACKGKAHRPEHLGYAGRRVLVSRNVARLAALPPERPARLQPWSAAEARMFLRAARRDPLYPALVLLVVYGLRRGEVLGLSWKDVDLEHGVIRIRQQLFRVSGRLQLGPVKTAAGRRDLPLLGIAGDALTRQASLRVIGGNSHEWTSRDLVFTTRTGRPVEPRNLARSFERITAKARLRPIRLHDLRHTTATLLKDLGVPPRDTMDVLGHTRIAVTMEVYTGADNASRREAIGKLSALFGGDPE